MPDPTIASTSATPSPDAGQASTASLGEVTQGNIMAGALKPSMRPSGDMRLPSSIDAGVDSEGDGDGGEDGGKVLSLEEFGESFTTPEPAKLKSVKDDIGRDAAEVETPVVKPPAETPVVPTTKPSRDYSTFDEEGQRVLKRAQNDVFDYAKKLQIKVKEQEALLTKTQKEFEAAKQGRLPESWTDHPEAFTLSPEYKTVAADYEQDSFEESHWAEVLERIEEGKAWKNLVGYDKNGRPQFETVEPRKNSDGDIILDVKSKIAVQRALQTAGMNKMQTMGRLQSVVQGFKSTVEGSRREVEEFEHKSFPGLKEPSEELKKEIESAVSRLPQAIQRSPAAKLIAKGSLLVNALSQRIKTLEAELAKGQTIAADRKLAGPGSAELTAASSAGKSNELRMADFGDD